MPRFLIVHLPSHLEPLLITTKWPQHLAAARASYDTLFQERGLHIPTEYYCNTMNFFQTFLEKKRCTGCIFFFFKFKHCSDNRGFECFSAKLQLSLVHCDLSAWTLCCTGKSKMYGWNQSIKSLECVKIAKSSALSFWTFLSMWNIAL